MSITVLNREKELLNKTQEALKEVNTKRAELNTRYALAYEADFESAKAIFGQYLCPTNLSSFMSADEYTKIYFKDSCEVAEADAKERGVLLERYLKLKDQERMARLRMRRCLKRPQRNALVGVV